jgi:hypothetical protein
MLALCVLAFGVEGWVLWGHGPWLALAYIMTALPALLMTRLVLKRRRELDNGAP